MKNLPRITEIIKIEAFKITCRWTTGEIKVMDFETEFSKWKTNNQLFLLKLKNFNKFENVAIKDGTLQWNSIKVCFTALNGEKVTNFLDLDPDMLYKKSNSLDKYQLICIRSL